MPLDLVSEWTELSTTDLEAIETGSYSLKPRHLLLVAKALHWDVEELIKPRANSVENRMQALFRQNQQVTRDDRIALADLAKRASTLPELTPNRALPTPMSPRKGYHRQEGRRIATAFRRLAGLKGPLKNPFELCRRFGIQLFRINFSTPNLSGVTIFHDAFGAAIAIRRQDDLFRQCFSCMHELGHVIMDRGEAAKVSFENKGDATEWRANGFATGMLLPTSVLKDGYERFGLELAHWTPILQSCRTNPGTLIYALRDEQLIDKGKAEELFHIAPRLEAVVKLDPDLDGISQGALARLETLAEFGLSPELADTIEAALRTGTVSWTWAAEQLRLTNDQLDELMGQAPANLRRTLSTSINTKAIE